MADENSELIIDEFFTNDTDDTVEDNENTEQNDKTADIANQVSDSEHSESTDPSTLPSDGYTEDNSTDAGEAGEPIEEQTQPTSLENLPIRYKIENVVSLIGLPDYFPETITALRNEGKQAVAVFMDGTSKQVTWDDVFDPSTLARPAIKSEVLELLEATNQHFWNDTNGVHVNNDDKDSWDTEYAKNNHGTLNTPTRAKPWHNILINSFGILLRRGLINHVSVTESAIAFYDGSGNDDQNIIANFGATAAQIGKSSARHISLTNSGLDIIDGSGISQAFFGATARIGASNAAHAIVNDNGLFVYDANGNLAKINAIDIVAVNEATQAAVTKSNEAAQAASAAATSASNAATSASNAESSASAAATSASNASSSASAAAMSASNASSSASAAATSASAAATSASNAELSSIDAATSARNALRGLDTVQDVVNVTKWIADHKVLTTDTSPQSGTVYYEQDSTTGQISRVDPYDVTTDAVPQSGVTYYTNQNGNYIEFTGNEFDSQTIYYTAQNPSQQGYYVLDEKVANYLASHIVQTNYGLNLLVDDVDTYVNIGTVDGDEPIGFHIIDESGSIVQSVTQYYTRIGSDSTQNILINNSSIQVGGNNFSRIVLRPEALSMYTSFTMQIGSSGDNSPYFVLDSEGIHIGKLSKPKTNIKHGYIDITNLASRKVLYTELTEQIESITITRTIEDVDDPNDPLYFADVSRLKQIEPYDDIVYGLIIYSMAHNSSYDQYFGNYTKSEYLSRIKKMVDVSEISAKQYDANGNEISQNLMITVFDNNKITYSDVFVYLYIRVTGIASSATKIIFTLTLNSILKDDTFELFVDGDEIIGTPSSNRVHITDNFIKIYNSSNSNFFSVNDSNITYGILHSDLNGRIHTGRSLTLISDLYNDILNKDDFVGIYAQTKRRGGWAFRVFGNDTDEYGNAIVMGDGGLFVAGAGESAESMYNAIIASGSNQGREDAFLTADGSVFIIPNCNTIANRIEYNFGSGGLNMKKKTINELNNIEFNPGSNTSNHGGFLDFHYNQSTADYTSRIIEDESGCVSFDNTHVP